MRNRCEKFDHRLQWLLDQRRAIDGDVRLQRHASGCEACRRSWAAHQLLVEALESRCAAQAAFGESATITLAESDDSARVQAAHDVPAIAPEFSRRLSAQLSRSLAEPVGAALRGDECDGGHDLKHDLKHDMRIEPHVAPGMAARGLKRANRWAVVAALAAALVLMVLGARHRAASDPGAGQHAVPDASQVRSFTLHETAAPIQASSQESPRPANAVDRAHIAISQVGSGIGAIAHRSNTPSLPGDAIEADTRLRVQQIALQTGGQLAAAARRLTGIDEAQASLDGRETPASVRGVDTGSGNSWSDSIPAALELWFETLPPRDQGSRS